ncbi:MAG TPA: Dyp-type peroxidase [Solirubrobacteraceae bacterium]|nr:Dyp-type peroxidase [Solirubrobacteraceae bacterium]
MNRRPPGIANRPPAHALLFSLKLSTADAPTTEAALERLREVQRQELRSELPALTPASNKEAPSPETGELGVADGYDRAFLTITIGLGRRVFELLGTPPEQYPQDLEAIPWEKLGDTPDTAENGDVLVQACSDDIYINEHVLRRIQAELPDIFTVAWVIDGHQRYNTRSGRVSREEGRALIGFLDGTSNLDPRNSEEDAKLVFVDPGAVASYPPLPTPAPGQPNPYGGQQPPEFPGDLRPPPGHEPEWATNGSYCVVRASTLDLARWDRETLGIQERTIGRFKYSGASLDLADDVAELHAEPDFAANPSDERVALDAHVRKVNPRGPGDAQRRIFRRGYPLIEPLTGEARRGLLFIAFARSLSTQFEFIERAWRRNPEFPHAAAGVDLLVGFEHVLCGGYFFVPALEHANQPWSWVLPAGAAGA